MMALSLKTLTLQKLKRLSHGTCAIGTMIALGSMGSTAHAGNMYVYKDGDGQVLLTNVNPSGNFDKFTQKVKVTYYPSGSSAAEAGASNTAAINAPASYRGFSTPSRSANRNAYDHLIRASAKKHGVDPALMKAMMHSESAFNPRARSPVGAQGLMQLMPATARRFGVYNAWDPAQNIEGAAKYIAWLTKRFKGNVEHVVAGYNAGEGNVDKYGGIPPFRETRGYVKKVLGRYNSLYKNDSSLFNTSGVRSVTGNNVTIQRASYGTSNNQIGNAQISRASIQSGGQNSNYAQSAFDALGQ